MTTETRCENCGCAVDAGATTCAACGRSIELPVAASVAAVGAREYAMAPLAPGPYDVELGVAESLSWTFRIWADNLPRLALLALVPYAFMIPFVIFGFAAAFAPTEVSSVAPGVADALRFNSTFPSLWIGAGGLALALLMIVASLASVAGSIHLVDEKVRGVRVTAMTAFLAGLRHVGWMFLGWILASALGVFAIAGPVAPIIVAVSANEPLVALFALPGLVTTALALIVAARLAPALPALVVEDRPLGAALVRAWDLTRGKTGVVVGATVVFGLGYFGLSMMSAMAGVVPLFGIVLQLAINAAITPLVYVFPFALYAGAVREQQRQFR
jgi:hypothetical protein